jgi:release factor glutamine methyltransferase
VVATLRAAGCVFAEDEAQLLIAAATSDAELNALVGQRASGIPLEQVVGWAEFCGIRIVVEPGVFVPRPRTELLAHEAVALTRPGDVVVELCCGAGALSAVLLDAVERIEVTAADIEPAAARCARRNIGDRGAVFEGDLFDALPAALRGRVDVIAANAPYVPTGEVDFLPPEARIHEPLVALDGGADGLDVLRRVIAGARPWLADGGYVLVESSERQAPALTAAFVAAGFSVRQASCEELGATVLIGKS